MKDKRQGDDLAQNPPIMMSGREDTSEPHQVIGTWRVMSGGLEDGYAVIQEFTDMDWRTKGPMLTIDQAEWLIVSHNEVVKKLNERTIRQVCEDSGVPIKMTRDGVEVGDKYEPDYEAGIDIEGDRFSIYGLTFEIGDPDSTILEYDLPDGSCKRVLIDDEQYVVPMYPRLGFLETYGEENQTECKMASIWGNKIEQPDRIILMHSKHPEYSEMRITINDREVVTEEVDGNKRIRKTFTSFRSMFENAKAGKDMSIGSGDRK